uniref:BCL2 interacting protein 1 n=4 Tax=Equus TaxID=9789 RepID=F7CV19_HORSE|nr:vesicle transport protein SEC20 isoform X1 [Equus caballus]
MADRRRMGRGPCQNALGPPFPLPLGFIRTGREARPGRPRVGRVAGLGAACSFAPGRALGGAAVRPAARERACIWAPPRPVAGVSNMAAPQDVHVRICNQEIVKFDLEVKALIQDIRDCSGPLSALTELNSKVKEKFQQLRHRIQELEQSAKEQDRESEKQVLLQEVENHKKQMLSNQTSWRKANLTCKIAIDNLEKAELLRGGDLLRQRKTTKESLAQTSSAITESLMGISRMMSQQVQQSEEAMQTLVNSSRTILDANEEFKSMSGTIQLGRKLITKYNRRELTDKLLIFLALALFLATVLYIVKKRLFPFL